MGAETIFQTRAAARRVVREMEEKLGRKLSNDEISMRCIRAGQKGKKHFNGGSQRTAVAQLSADERQSLQTLRASARASRLPRIALVENQVLNHAVAHVFERKSVVPEHELLNIALSHRLGDVDLNHLKTAVKHLTVW